MLEYSVVFTLFSDALLLLMSIVFILLSQILVVILSYLQDKFLKFQGLPVLEVTGITA